MVTFPLALCLFGVWTLLGGFTVGNSLHQRLPTTNGATGTDPSVWLPHANIVRSDHPSCLCGLEFCCFSNVFSQNASSAPSVSGNKQKCATVSFFKQKCLITMLLLLSGIHPNPGPPATCTLPEDFKNISGLHIIHVNTRSLLSNMKMDMLKTWVKSTGAHVIVISESWLSKSVSDKVVAIKGFNLYRTDRPRKGGGVAIYVKSSISAQVLLSKSVAKQFELLALRIDLSAGHYLTVVGCYRPPSATADALPSLMQHLSQLQFKEIILVGDLNWDWLSSVSDPFKAECLSLNLTQIIECPTRLNPRCLEKSSLIDLFITNVPHKYSATGVFANDLSDHCVIGAVRDAKIPRFKPRIIQKRNLKHFVEQAFLHDLADVNWDRIQLIDDISHAWSYFYESFTYFIDKHAPLRSFRVKGRDSPWFTTKLTDLLRERNQLWANARKSGSEADWLLFRQARNRCTASIKEAKRDFYLSQTTDNLNDPRKFWQSINSLSEHPCSSELPPHLVVDSTFVSDKSEMLNCFNKHFISSSTLFDTSRDGTSASPPPVSHASPVHSFSFSPFSVREVHRALKDLDPRKSAGPDNLPPYFLRLAADFIARPLAHIFNLSTQSNIIPDVWKTAHVLPLHKGGDPTILNNYRPISKLSVLAKILEKLVNNQIKQFLCQNNVLSPQQSGFRKQHSTSTAVTKVLNDFLVAMDDNNYCAALFLDLSKAFDTVDHNILCQRLSSIGMSDHTVGWFSNYLTNRKQYVQSDGIFSGVLNIVNGVPQGSVLAPTLFTIYMNNLGANTNASVHLYADDTAVYCSSSTVSQVFNDLQSAFNIIQAQLSQLRLVLNASKTKAMLFSNKKRVPAVLPSILTAHGTPIELVTTYKYLGVIVDNSLSFKHHIDHMLKKLKVKLGFFFRNRSCFSFSTRKRLVATTFLPILDYCDVVYRNASANSLHLLDSVYHGALRFITGAGPLTHHCTLYSLSGWSSLSSRRFTHWYTFVYKAMLGLLPSYLSTYLAQRMSTHSLRSQDFITLAVPIVRTELGKKAFSYSAPATWNKLQQDLKLSDLIPFGEFKGLIGRLERATIGACDCS